MPDVVSIHAHDRNSGRLAPARYSSGKTMFQSTPTTEIAGDAPDRHRRHPQHLVSIHAHYRNSGRQTITCDTAHACTVSIHAHYRNSGRPNGSRLMPVLTTFQSTPTTEIAGDLRPPVDRAPSHQVSIHAHYRNSGRPTGWVGLKYGTLVSIHAHYRNSGRPQCGRVVAHDPGVSIHAHYRNSGRRVSDVMGWPVDWFQSTPTTEIAGD